MNPCSGVVRRNGQQRPCLKPEGHWGMHDATGLSPAFVACQQQRKPIRREAPRRARENRSYRLSRRVFLTEHPRCEFPSGCTQPATEVHHRKGRTGALLLDQSHWSALCHSHHVQMGDRMVPAVVELEHTSEGEPTLYLRCEVINGAPQCREVRIYCPEGADEIRSTDVKIRMAGRWVGVDELRGRSSRQVAERPKGRVLMASIEDRWLAERDGVKVPTARHGSGNRWRAHYRDPAGKQRNRAFARKIDAERFLTTVESSKLAGTYVDPRAGVLTVSQFYEQWSKRQVWTSGTARVTEHPAEAVAMGISELRVGVA